MKRENTGLHQIASIVGETRPRLMSAHRKVRAMARGGDAQRLLVVSPEKARGEKLGDFLVDSGYFESYAVVPDPEAANSALQEDLTFNLVLADPILNGASSRITTQVPVVTAPESAHDLAVMVADLRSSK